MVTLTLLEFYIEKCENDESITVRISCGYTVGLSLRRSNCWGGEGGIMELRISHFCT